VQTEKGAGELLTCSFSLSSILFNTVQEGCKIVSGEKKLMAWLIDSINWLDLSYAGMIY